MSSRVTVPSNAERLASRTLKRKTTADAKRVTADALKDRGNDHYKKAQYEDAIACYENAILTYGPRTVYLNNLAACLLKLERYEEAELAASRALQRDRTLLKARYRKALAKKGQGDYRAALRHLKIVVTQDPEAREARLELASVLQLLEVQRHTEDDTDSPVDTDSDNDVSFSGAETLVLSDSSDYEHVGNGTPCRYYNHDGCARGPKCKFKHAPDNRSVRDNLGRNVCLFYMLDLCKFADLKCVYAHDKTYLPPSPKRWDSPKWLTATRDLVIFWGAHQSAKKMEKLAGIIKPPITHRACLPRVILHDSKRMVLGVLDHLIMSKEVDERMENYGFTNDEVHDLLCQGVKPWDDEAWDVLNALHDM